LLRRGFFIARCIFEIYLPKCRKIRALWHLAKQIFIGFLTMVIIRMSRGGSKNRPFFNVVVADSRNRRDGRFIERIGFYNPLAAEGQEGLRLDLGRVTHWQDKGAQLSDAVAKLVKRAGATATA
jgi:small subunit ribosomal protein S16